jgi:putative FmdB family regulatory protein
MPLYEYKCDTCGDIFEVMQKFSDEPVKVHENCGGTVERLISAPSLQFKGSGFYITDYGKSGSKTAGENGSGHKSDSAGTKSSGGSESGSTSSSSSESKSGSSDSKSTPSTTTSSSSESK